MNEFEKKVLKVAAEICELYSIVVSNRTCQDWEGKDLPFTREELKSLVFCYQQWNSGGDDYDEDELSESDGMMVASYIERALLQFINEDAQQKQAKTKNFSDNKLLEVINKDLIAEVARLKDVLLAVYFARDSYAQENEAVKNDRDFYRAKMNERTKDIDRLTKENQALTKEIKLLQQENQSLWEQSLIANDSK